MKIPKNKVKDRVLLGGILKSNGVGYGFKIVMKDLKKIQYYKEMFEFIFKHDGFLVEFQKGLYDKKE